MGAEQTEPGFAMERTWITKDGREKYIKELSEQELEDAIIDMIKEAVYKEWCDKHGQDKYKNSWQTYVKRHYWECCQYAWKKKMRIQGLIDNKVAEEYAAIKANPPRFKVKKKDKSNPYANVGGTANTDSFILDDEDVVGIAPFTTGGGLTIGAPVPLFDVPESPAIEEDEED